MAYTETIEKFKEHLKMKGFAESTIKHYEGGLKKFTEYLDKEKGIKRIQEIKKEHIRDYQNIVHTAKRQRDARPVSISQKGTWLLAVKMYFKYLVKTAEVMYNPAIDIDLPRRKEPLREVLKVKEMKKILESASGKSAVELRDRAMMEVFYSTGIRNTELREIKLSDIDLDRGEIKILKGKGGKERIVPVGRIAAAYIEEYIREARPKFIWATDNEHLFISYRGRKLAITAPNQIIKKYAKKANIKKNVKTHMLRHSCATHLLKGGADIRYVQEILGHKSLDSTQVYTKVEISDLKRVHKRTHPRERV